MSPVIYGVQVYQERGVKDKERYRSEMEEYRERQKTGQIISNAVPIQQRRAMPEVAMVEADPKVEAEECISPQTLEDGSSSGETDSEEKTADKDSEMEASPGAGNGSESTNAAPGVSTEGDDFELRRRDGKVGDESEVQCSSLENVSEPMTKESIISEGH